MDADKQGSLSASQTKRLYRAFGFMALNTAGLLFLLFLGYFERREKDQQIDRLIEVQESLVDTQQSLTDHVESLTHVVGKMQTSIKTDE